MGDAPRAVVAGEFCAWCCDVCDPAKAQLLLLECNECGWSQFHQSCYIKKTRWTLNPFCRSTCCRRVVHTTATLAAHKVLEAQPNTILMNMALVPISSLFQAKAAQRLCERQPPTRRTSVRQDNSGGGVRRPRRDCL